MECMDCGHIPSKNWWLHECKRAPAQEENEEMGFDEEPMAYEDELADECRKLVAERDSLRAQLAASAAENAEWKAAHTQLVIDYEQVLADLETSDATLDALREGLPEYDTGPEDWEFGDLMRCVADFHNILYPQPAALAEEKTNG